MTFQYFLHGAEGVYILNVQMFHTLMFAFSQNPKKTSGWEISANVKKEYPIIRHNTTKMNSQRPNIIQNY